MKKIIYLFICLFGIASICSATTALYRISSGEVIAISTEDNPYTGNPDIFAVISNATYPDGTTFSKRVLGAAKILDGTVIRNATQSEIDAFQAAAIDDRNIKDAAEAIEYLQTDAKIRRILTAFADIIVSEINILRSEHGLPDRTLSQLKTAIENRISKDD